MSPLLRRLVGAMLACLLLALAITSAYHDHGVPLGCRSSPHVHSQDSFRESCAVCRQSHLRAPSPEVRESAASLSPEPGTVRSRPQVPADALLVFDRPARAPPSRSTRAL